MLLTSRQASFEKQKIKNTKNQKKKKFRNFQKQLL